MNQALCVGVELRICAPPYQQVTPVRLAENGGAPPLGAVVYAAGQSVLAMLEQLAGAIKKWPWVAPCIALSPMEYVAEQYGALQRPFGVRLAVVQAATGQRVSPEAIARAVAVRAQPSAGSLTGWIVARLRAQDLASPLVERLGWALGERPDLPRSVSSYSRLFARHPGLKAAEWDRVAKLVRALDRAGRVQFGRPAGVASVNGGRLSARTLSAYSVKYLGRTTNSAIQIVGWEWILETVVRRRLFALSH